MTTSTDVLIAGAGPVGLSLALELARRDVRLRIIDQSEGPSTKSKAVGVHARTLEIFQTLGLADRLIAAGVKVHRGMFHLGGKHHAEISFDHLQTPFPFVLCVPQFETERILGEELARLGVAVERQTRLDGFTQTESGVQATLIGPGGQEMVACGYLAGCDGAHSTVRHELGMKFEGALYPEQLILADVQVETPLARDAMHMFTHPNGLVAWFPLPGNRFRLMADVTSAYPDAGDRVPTPTLEEFQHIIDERVGPGSVLSDAAWLSSFRIHHRKVTHYREGRVFVAGDAAHIHSPAGGQGMNTGIQDAVNLAWKLTLAVGGKASEALLDSYSIEREPVAAAVVKLSDRMTRMISASGATASIRDVLMPFLAGLHAVEEKMTRQMSQIAVNYRHSPIVGSDWHGESPELHAGDRAPWIPEAETPRFQLLIFPGDPAELDSMLRALPARLGATTVVARQPYAARQGEQVVLDEEGEIHRQYGVHGACAWLIRPDGYIAYRCMPLQPEGLRRNLTLSIGS